MKLIDGNVDWWVHSYDLGTVDALTSVYSKASVEFFVDGANVQR